MGMSYQHDRVRSNACEASIGHHTGCWLGGQELPGVLPGRLSSLVDLTPTRDWMVTNSTEGGTSWISHSWLVDKSIAKHGISRPCSPIMATMAACHLVASSSHLVASPDFRWRSFARDASRSAVPFPTHEHHRNSCGVSG